MAAFAQDLPEVTLEQAVEGAMTTAGVRAATEGERAAGARLDQARGSRWPAVGVSVSTQVWNQAQEVQFVSGGDVDCGALTDPFIAGLCAGLSEPLVVRDMVTASISARTGMPLTGQLSIAQRIDAAEAGRDAAHANVGLAGAEARYQAEDTWYLALQADRQLAIAEAQVKSLQSRVDSAGVAYQGGTVTRNDVLKAELALARAEQQLIQLRSLRDVARARLGIASGHGGTLVVPVGAPVAPPEMPTAGVEALIEQALSRRFDLTALRAQVSAADHGARAADLDRLPQVGVNASYLHTEGQGAFALPDSGFVGATLDWTVFAWRARDAGVDAARASADQVRAQLDVASAQAGLEVLSRYSALDAALKAWAVAERSVQQAEENLRIQDTLRAAGSGTMTDLLDAEAARVEAQSRTAAALYDAHRAAAALRRALGE